MTYELFTALITFALVSSITPGPNNLMLMASAANFGLLRSLPHMFGIGLGFVLMIVLVGMGLAQIFDVFPIATTILKTASIFFLLFLAYKIATAAPDLSAPTETRPLTFLQAAAFQWVNPKAWAMALTALTAYTTSQTFTGIAIVALTFGAVNLPSILCWAVLGLQMRRFLTNPTRLRIFNWTMAALLVATLYPILKTA